MSAAHKVQPLRFEALGRELTRGRFCPFAATTVVRDVHEQHVDMSSAQCGELTGKGFGKGAGGEIADAVVASFVAGHLRWN